MTNDLSTIAAAYFPESADRTARCLQALKTDREQIVKWANECAARFEALANEPGREDSMITVDAAMSAAYSRLAQELSSVPKE